MSPASTQTVSMLITDLVGSTALADRIGPVAAEELRSDHFGLLRGALERTGGREVKNLGDGLMTVFDSASQSLLCAVEMQQAIEARNRRAEEPLAVRIGVSIGEAVLEEGDYFGWPAVEATRLCAAAEGGQIVVSALVRQVAGARQDDRFQPLGALELKGISEPVEAFELRWEPLLSTGIALPERLREVPATGYVGRQAERDRLTELWADADERSLQLALISGEAGVGKTRLATHLALQVREQGATVLYGRCDEDLGVPYQPWGQALGYLVAEAPQSVLDAHVHAQGGDLARLIPALADRVPGLPAARQSDPETERFLLYAAAAGLLEQASQVEPLLLILDDLHWADQPTLSLLRHIVSSDASMRVMVVGTYRDSDLSRDHPLTPLLADLHREQAGERVRLTGLESDDVLALMAALAGQELDEDARALAQAITRETAGNPFFAGELLRHLIESGAIVRENDGRWRLVGDLDELGLPQSVREVIGRRVERLGPEARAVLSAAAVIGRDFDLDLLLAVLEVTETQLLDVLDQAVAASLLKESTERAGRFTFTHALVEHTLYEDLGRARRARLHERVARALEDECGDEPGERLGELAGHWAAAVVSGDSTKAIHYARRAAERALEQLAPDEALRWYGQALELHEQAPAGARSERCELLIGLGEAQRQVGKSEFRQTLLQAAELAQELGDADRLCRAVLANSREWITASQFGAIDSERVRALEVAAGALAEDDRRRAPVLALLAYELRYGGELDRCEALAEQAVEIARDAGDPATLARTLANATAATWGIDSLAERQAVAEELVELVEQLDDPRLSFWAALRRMVVGLQAAERSQVESGIAAMRTLAASVPEPLIVWTRLKLESVWALVRGDLEAAEQWAIQAHKVGEASGQPDAGPSLFGQVIRVRYFQGRYKELLDPLLGWADRPNTLAVSRASAAMALIESGREDEALERLLAANLQGSRSDETWLMALLQWGDVCSRLRDAGRADELYALLTPFSGQFVAGGTIVSGPSDLMLAMLAAILERNETAERHFAAATEITERLGAPLFLARTQVSWARALTAHGRRDDLARAQHMLEQAENVAGRLGAAGITREVAESRAALVATVG
jgi:class 3 adenylate cyclase/tetratricopeptide (TPR) repeat protein